MPNEFFESLVPEVEGNKDNEQSDIEQDTQYGPQAPQGKGHVRIVGDGQTPDGKCALVSHPTTKNCDRWMQVGVTDQIDCDVALAVGNELLDFFKAHWPGGPSSVTAEERKTARKQGNDRKCRLISNHIGKKRKT